MTDQDFWSARTDWWSMDGWNVSGQQDGVHVSGWYTHDNGSLKNMNCGEKSTYVIGVDRLPKMGCAQYVSRPQVKIFGEITGQTTPGSFPDDLGDHWSKCWLHLRQTLFENLNDGSRHTVEEAQDDRNLFFIEDSGDTRSYSFDSVSDNIVNIPVVAMNRPGDYIPGNDLWAEVEVSYNVQIEGPGSVVESTGGMVIQGWQWPLEVS
ncbi:hypothetical protein [Streptomyces mobaraensis]|uniref:hypothetical protein n=1 Tax=Streptomyces mobaraensis TaxID=35621 RepID=UPI0033EFB4C1